MNSGMEAEALALVEKSLRLDPENPKSWQLRGELSFQQKDYTQALDTSAVVTNSIPRTCGYSVRWPRFTCSLMIGKRRRNTST